MSFDQFAVCFHGEFAPVEQAMERHRGAGTHYGEFVEHQHQPVQ
jgi:hypothetical protein